jgi:uncharacterized protein YbaR (Trm112 family)
MECLNRHQRKCHCSISHPQKDAVKKKCLKCLQIFLVCPRCHGKLNVVASQQSQSSSHTPSVPTQSFHSSKSTPVPINRTFNPVINTRGVPTGAIPMSVKLSSLKSANTPPKTQYPLQPHFPLQQSQYLSHPTPYVSQQKQPHFPSQLRQEYSSQLQSLHHNQLQLDQLHQQNPSAQNQYPSSQNQYPSAQNQYPSAQNQYPSAQNQYPSAQNQYPSAQNPNSKQQLITRYPSNPNLPSTSYQLQPRQAQLQPHQAQLQPHQAQLQPHQAQLQPHQAQLQPHQAQLQPHQVQLQPHQVQLQPHQVQLQPRQSQFSSAQNLQPLSQTQHHQQQRYQSQQRMTTYNNQESINGLIHPQEFLNVSTNTINPKGQPNAKINNNQAKKPDLNDETESDIYHSEEYSVSKKNNKDDQTAHLCKCRHSKGHEINDANRLRHYYLDDLTTILTNDKHDCFNDRVYMNREESEAMVRKNRHGEVVYRRYPQGERSHTDVSTTYDRYSEPLRKSKKSSKKVSKKSIKKKPRSDSLSLESQSYTLNGSDNERWPEYRPGHSDDSGKRFRREIAQKKHHYRYGPKRKSYRRST